LFLAAQELAGMPTEDRDDQGHCSDSGRIFRSLMDQIADKGARPLQTRSTESVDSSVLSNIATISQEVADAKARGTSPSVKRNGIDNN
jgi:hypothetical protein